MKKLQKVLDWQYAQFLESKTALGVHGYAIEHEANGFVITHDGIEISKGCVPSPRKPPTNYDHRKEMTRWNLEKALVDAQLHLYSNTTESQRLARSAAYKGAAAVNTTVLAADTTARACSMLRPT